VRASSCTEATEAAVAILVAGIAPAAERSSATDADGSAVAAGSSEAGTVAADRSVASVLEPRTELAVTPLLAAELGFDVGSLVSISPMLQLSAGLELDRFVIAAFAGATGRVMGELQGYAAGAQMFLLLGGAASIGTSRTKPSLRSE
jgi:hypothetical protein